MSSVYDLPLSIPRVCTVCHTPFEPPLECDAMGIFKGDGFTIQENLEWALKGLPAGEIVQAIELKGETWILHGPKGLMGGCTISYTRDELGKLMQGFSVRQHVLLRRTEFCDPPLPHVKPVITKTGKVGMVNDPDLHDYYNPNEAEDYLDDLEQEDKTAFEPDDIGSK